MFVLRKKERGNLCYSSPRFEALACPRSWNEQRQSPRIPTIPAGPIRRWLDAWNGFKIYIDDTLPSSTSFCEFTRFEPSKDERSIRPFLVKNAILNCETKPLCTNFLLGRQNNNSFCVSDIKGLYMVHTLHKTAPQRYNLFLIVQKNVEKNIKTMHSERVFGNKALWRLWAVPHREPTGKRSGTKDGLRPKIRLFAKFSAFVHNRLAISPFWRFQKSLKTSEKG